MPSPRQTDARPHLVVKIGGSLHASPLLARWFDALDAYPHALTVVPGGGPFADAVRAAQPVMGYSDIAAHGMALLAMEQYGLALARQAPRLAPAATVDEIAAAHAHGDIALWRPSVMVSQATDITPCWDVTSDSLAAWLAQQTQATALLLIKSVNVASGADLVSCGVVDPAFPTYVDDTPVFIAGPAALASASGLLAAGVTPGARVSQQKNAS